MLNHQELFSDTVISSSTVGLKAMALLRLFQTKIVAVYFPGLSGIHDTEGEKDCSSYKVPVIQDRAAKINVPERVPEQVLDSDADKEA